jgi:hypothetical protein
MNTLFELPWAVAILINLVDAKRITQDLFNEAMEDPYLARMIVQHEMQHDIIRIQRS